MWRERAFGLVVRPLQPYKYMIMSDRITSKQIKAEATDLGFSVCGVARADRISDAEAAKLLRWINADGYADMSYMANNVDKRIDPRLLMDGLKSIVSVAMNYTPARKMPAGELQFAAYALGKDYHDIMKARLHALAARIGVTHYRAFCDSAPVLERYWAVQAGLGWVGRNHQLIVPRAGSMFFLGELFLDFELEYDSPVESRCGSCHACIDACPTHAIRLGGADGMESVFNAALCLSYQTIENRGDIPREVAEKMGDTVYGCDRCQAACPWNRFAKPTSEPLLQPRDELISMTRERWSTLTVEQYRNLFKGSAVKRAKYEGLMRNIKAIENNNK